MENKARKFTVIFDGTVCEEGRLNMNMQIQSPNGIAAPVLVEAFFTGLLELLQNIYSTKRCDSADLHFYNVLVPLMLNKIADATKCIIAEITNPTPEDSGNSGFKTIN